MVRKTHPDRQYLYELIKDKEGVNEELYLNFLYVLDAPDQLPMIHAIADRFVLAMRTDRVKDWPDHELFSEILPAANAIRSLKKPAKKSRKLKYFLDHWTRNFHEEKQRGRKRKISPVRGTITNHPIYSIWAFSQEGEEWTRKNFRLWQLHLLAASLFWRKSHSDWEGLYIDECRKSLGELSLSDHRDKFDLLPQELPTKDLISYWRTKNPEETLSEEETDKLKQARRSRFGSVMRTILRMLSLEEIGEGFGYKKTKTFRGRVYIDWRANFLEFGAKEIAPIFEEEEEDFEIAVFDDDLEIVQELDEQDIHPGESLESNLVGISGASKDTRPGFLYGKHQEKQLQMQAQNLPYTQNDLALPEIAMIMLVAGKMFRTARESFNETRSKKNQDNMTAKKEAIKTMQFVVILMVQVWFGRNWQMAKNIVESRSKDIGPNDIQLRKEGEVFHWRLSVVKPSSGGLEEASQGQQREVADYVAIPDLPKFANFYKSLKSCIGSINRKEVFADFDKQAYRASMNQLREILRTEYLTDINPTDSQLSRFLMRQLVEAGYDEVLAALITGRKYPSTDVPLHYFTPSAQYLVEAYVKTVRSTLERIYDEWPDNEARPSKGWADVSIPAFSGYVGVKQCPTLDTIQDLSNNLKAELKLRKVQGLEHKHIEDIRRHNTYTIYTRMVIVFGTSFRSVTDVFLKDEWINEELSVAVISDKDGIAKGEVESFFNTRHIGLPRTVIKTIKFWKAHRMIAVERFFPDRSTLTDKQNKLLDSGDLFLIEDGKPVACKPGKVEESVKEYFGFKLNANRRFSRTTMSEEGVDIEHVNGALSHWDFGQQIWGTFSSMPYEGYLDTTRDQFSQMLKDMGWVAVSSPFRRSSK